MTIAYARGRDKFDARPEMREAPDFRAFADAILKDRARKKGKQWFSGPFNGDGRRCAEGAQPRGFLPVDVDGIKPEKLPDLRLWCARFQGFGYATASSTPGAPRERYVLALNRAATRDECVRLGAAFIDAVKEQFGDAVKIDPDCFRNEQPCYTPVGRVEPVFFTGEPMSVDAWLQKAPPESESRRAGTDGKIPSGQRNKHLSDFAFALRKKGFSIEGIEVALLEENRARCEPPLGEAEVRAIARGKTGIDPDESVHGGLRLKCNKSGPLPNLANVVTVLTEHEAWRGRIYYDEFYGRIFTTESDGPPREWSDRDDIRVTVWLQSVIGIDHVSVVTVADGVRHVAMLDRRDAVITDLESLRWDGQSRLPMLIARGLGATQNDYHAQVGANFLIGMVARALRPGCKVDTMPVFEGSQGTFKSTGLSIIGGEWFAEVHQSIDSKDFYLALRGKLLLEVSEMHAFNKAESERLKGVMSCQVDRYRAPYERRAADHPRRCVFAGTTNRDDWNRDDTGARRFWPVVCGHIDLDWLTGHRDQLLAEAVYKFKNGATWWEVPREHAEREQDARRVEDPWQPIIAEWLIGRTETTTNEILSRCILVGTDRMTKADEMRVGAVLRHLRWKKAFRGDPRDRERCWVRGT